MTTFPLLCAAYAFTATGFCLGFVACAVMSGPRANAPGHGYQPLPGGEPGQPPRAP